MKSLFKFLLLTAVVLVTSNLEAQTIKRAVKDSAVNAVTKYITFPSTPNGVQGFFITGTKSTGTVSGYAILQVSTDTIPNQAGRGWEDYQQAVYGKRDTLFFTDVTTAQQKSFPVPLQYFNGARFKIVTTGTQKLYLNAGYLRR